MSFPRYEKYKDSRERWLGKIPYHWTIARLGFECDTLVPMRDKPESLDGPIPWIRIEDFVGKFLSKSKSNQGVTSDVVRTMNLKILPVGTVLCSCSCSMGATAVVSVPLVTNQTFIGIVPKDGFVSDYLYYFFQSASDHLDSIGTGAIQSYLSRDDFRQLRLPKPPIEEQAEISGFLDQETTKIDALVEEQRKLIELLKEKRQAVISHAVTKGLNPDAPMKDSGVEWLGDVPSHWDVGPIKYFVQQRSGAIKTGPFGSHLTSADMQDSQVKVYNQRNVIDNDFSSGDNFISKEKFNQLLSFETVPGDLLVTTRGTIGRAAIMPDDAERGILHPCLLRIQPEISHLTVHFLKLLIQESTLVRTQLSYMSNATTIEVIYSETMTSVVIPVPPIYEQKAILKWLDQKITELNALTADTIHAIELLQERRSALISAAVTGKIDVRGLLKEEAA